MVLWDKEHTDKCRVTLYNYSTVYAGDIEGIQWIQYNYNLRDTINIDSGQGGEAFIEKFYLILKNIKEKRKSEKNM